MQVKTVKLNFILNIIRLFLSTAFILLITPYITRVLGPENLGKVEYANSIIIYLINFTALGIPVYGIREVAKYRDNQKELSKILIELSLILFVTTIVGYIILTLLLYKNFLEIRDIMLVTSLNLLLSNMGVEWFYQGIENQLYITKRFILVRVLALIATFLFVRNERDYLIYAFILVILQSGSSILNFINLRKYITFNRIKFFELEIKKHIKPIFIIFFATVATTIYLQLDSVMIGNINKEAVGIYTVPNKLIRMMLVIITALGSVLLPRITNCLKNKDYKNYNIYMNTSLNYIFFISIPVTVSCFLLADNIINIMAGSQFKDSVLTMKILSPILFTIGIAYFLGFQLLYPLGLEKYYTYSVIVAAIVNFIFNYFMIPKYLQNGAAMGTVIAEAVGPLIMLFFARKYLKKINFFSVKRLKYFVATFIMSLVIIFIKSFRINDGKTVFISILLGGFIYFLVLVLIKEEISIQIIKFFKSKIRGEEK
ncbi:flippase [Fusobacterium animalis]|uniref:flippase n=1 Tax=Fusobacterium animalis TaxID=76859 RepID=UPI0034E030EC